MRARKTRSNAVGQMLGPQDSGDAESRKISPFVVPKEVSPTSLFTDREKEKVRKRFDSLYKDLKPRPSYWLGGIEHTTMLAASPEEIQEKMIGLYSGVNIMSGLILSALVGLALDPIEVNTLPQEDLNLFGLEIRNYKQWLACVYNIFGSVCVVIQVLICCYSTFILGFMHSTPNQPELVYHYVFRGAPLYSVFVMTDTREQKFSLSDDEKLPFPFTTGSSQASHRQSRV